MTNPVLHFDATGTDKMSINRFNDNKCCIINVEFKIHSWGDISDFTDSELLEKAKEIFNTINKSSINL